MHRSRLAVAAALSLIACGDSSGPRPFDAAMDGALDAFDGSEPDAASDVGPDSGPDVGLDAASDGGVDGFGTIAGPCAMIHGELTTTTSSYFLNRLDFGDDVFDDPEDVPRLTPGAQEILAEGTAGGSSGLSEAFAFEVLARCEGATLIKSETEIVYTTSGALTDMLVEVEGVRLGVSVTRAFVFPPTDPFTVEIAEGRLTDKLTDILESSANVSPEDAWSKQALVLVAYGDMHAASLRAAYDALDPSLKADTIVYVVITDGMDAPLY